ncbi:MAG: HD domain-containing protein [Nitrospiraceae bacterium]|nr:HD domain-containing protein [Nitrospiraceae bacterium]
MSIRNNVLTIEQVKIILQPQFEYLAKSHGEVLWLHSFSVWSILSKLAARIPRFTDHERMLLEISALIHDIGKMRARSQEILTGERQGKLRHTATKEEISQYLSPFISSGLLDIDSKGIDQIWEFALHHHISEEQQKEAQTPAYGIYAEVVRYADWLSSMELLDMATIRQIQNGLEGVCKLAVFSVGRYPSPTTYHLLQEAIEKYRIKGWEVLSILDNGALFLGDTESIMPSKKEIVSSFANQLVAKSFEGVSIKGSYKYEILSGKAKDGPSQFLQVKQHFYKDMLGDIDLGPVLFLRTLMDLYSNSKKLSAKIIKQLPVVAILKAAGGPRGINKAKKEWDTERQKRKNDSQNKEWTTTNALIVDVFNNVTLAEILNDVDSGTEKYLRDMTSQELFEVLLQTAERWFPDSEGSALEENISYLVSMEEETDFEKLAKNVFERYKNYKSSRRASHALCEQCGLPSPQEATLSLNFPKYSGFTQVNPRAESDAPRVVCPLCIFDATQTRKDLQRGKSQVYVRAVSRIPELWQLYGDLRTRIDRLRQSLTNVREIKELSETEFADLPLPSHFMIPIQGKYKEDITEIPLHTERGTLFPIERVKNDASPKDLRAKYLAFYALLNMLGLEIHMGLEEQEGLFGEKTFEKRQGDWQSIYYEGLVTVILAGAIDKNNKYIFAQDLLEKSPSIVLSKLENAKIKKELLEKVIIFLIRTNLTIAERKGGVWTMKEILRDAAFFAEGVPKFFWNSKDYDSWRTGGSKYVVTKPVDRVLNALLQGGDFEEAFATFLSGLKEDISGDKTKEGSKATIDVKDLEVFAFEAKKIFQRYAELRNTNIPKFIQAKNGLRSAIYIVKRYENLKEVIKNETA